MYISACVQNLKKKIHLLLLVEVCYKEGFEMCIYVFGELLFGGTINEN